MLRGRQAGRTRGGRGCAVVACGVEVVTHFLHLIATHLHLLTQLTCNSAARTHAHTVPRSRHPRILRAAHALHARTHRDALHCTLFFAHVLFCVAIVSRNAMFTHVSTTSTQLNSAYEPQRYERLRIRSIRPLVPLPANGRMRTRNRNPLAVSLLRLPQKQPQVNQRKRNTIQTSNI